LWPPDQELEGVPAGRREEAAPSLRCVDMGQDRGGA
jgi:hypothetical protein